MPLYMDRHNLENATAEDVAVAHAKDLEVQDKHRVRYLSYWFDYERQHAFCLVEAPNSQSAEAVHREAHGFMPHKIVEVEAGRVAEFLGSPPIANPGQAYEDVAFRTILFTDIVGSTELTQRLGDAQAMRVLRRHDAAVREGLQKFSGREVKHTGDGIMASLFSASRGVECAIWIQRRVMELQGADPAEQFRVRIGLSAGEPVTEHNDLFGTAVQLAARLCAQAEPGGVLVSVAVKELCAGKPLPFSEHRELTMRGFDGPVRAYAVEWESKPAG